MASIEEDFREMVRGSDADAELREQLEHAARTVATGGPYVAAITSVLAIRPGRIHAARALAEGLARRYGLVVTVGDSTSCHVRFARPAEGE